MRTVKDISYGIIPILKEGGDLKVFLIYQYGSKGDVYWTFPKGHPEEGETPEESASRELFEETALILEHIDTTKEYIQEYTFQHEDTIIDKKVVYYAGFVNAPTFTIQEEEVKEAGWFSLSEARGKLTHNLAKTMFDEVIVQLQN